MIAALFQWTHCQNIEVASLCNVGGKRVAGELKELTSHTQRVKFPFLASEVQNAEWSQGQMRKRRRGAR